MSRPKNLKLVVSTSQEDAPLEVSMEEMAESMLRNVLKENPLSLLIAWEVPQVGNNLPQLKMMTAPNSHLIKLGYADQIFKTLFPAEEE